ncbi:MAG: CBS domain-containing protein, partial [Elusimicrobiota bacterium]
AGKLVMARPTETLFDALKKMRGSDISQLPVFDRSKLTGAVFEDAVLEFMLKGRDLKKMIVREAMGSVLPVVAPQARIDSLLRLISKEQPAVMVQLGRGKFDILTKYDILNAVSRLAERAGVSGNGPFAR